MSKVSTVTVAFIGTGLMGAPMARNLALAGLSVHAWNRSRQKAEAIGNGVAVMRTCADAARGADVCVVMVSNGEACRKVLFGENAITSTLPRGAQIVVTSTITHAEALEFSNAITGLGYGWVDAPVSGGTMAAEAGELSIMAGGSARDVEAVRDVLGSMGNLIHVGGPGTGVLTKLANQMVVASTIATIAEALTLVKQAGADLDRVREALMGGFAQSRVLELHGQRMIEGNFQPGGPAKYQLKDTRAAREAAAAVGLSLPVLDLVDQLFADLVANDGADLDHSALIAEIRRRNGLAHDAD